MSSTIKFTRDTERTLIYLAHGDTLSKIKAFTYQIAQYTTANIARVTVTIGSAMTIDEKPGDFQSIRHYGHFFFRRESDKKLYGFKLPAPTIDIFEEQPEGDLIITPEIGAIVAAWYSTLAGEAFIFHYGAFCGSNVS